MPTFGFSAFLRMLALNERPQRTVLRQRLRPGEGGYDYHRSLRLRATRLLVNREPLADVLRSCVDITVLHERDSAHAALQSVAEWREVHPGEIIGFAPSLFESEASEFKIHFTPDFGLAIGGLRTAVHIYNTQVPLDARLTYGALSCAAQGTGGGERPQDWAVIALRERRLYRLSEFGGDAQSLGIAMAAGLDRLIGSLRDELRLPPPRGDTRPSA